ncbi:ligase-associated DNA damage response endonuclease PdeM [Tropicimonas sp.]|uniref:ligase-associated DNA damage response endonuclease PdeM n=1 Tax=Tropicimonas sp. TaxID=2067044 RepID=UPI003A87A5D4
MNTYPFRLAGADLAALPSGAMWWPGERLLCVADLHLGKSERMARRGGGLLPPYDGTETLGRLDAAIAATRPETVICLGDSFDDLAASACLPEAQDLWLTRMMAGLRWIWIEGNHDPGPLDHGGEHRREYRRQGLVFRHIAETGPQSGEVSGHFHPKATLRGRGAAIRRACFLTDGRRLILPAFGAYTGGMDCTAPELASLMDAQAHAILTGPTPVSFPVAAGRTRR